MSVVYPRAAILLVSYRVQFSMIVQCGCQCDVTKLYKMSAGFQIVYISMDRTFIVHFQFILDTTVMAIFIFFDYMCGIGYYLLVSNKS